MKSSIISTLVSTTLLAGSAFADNNLAGAIYSTNPTLNYSGTPASDSFVYEETTPGQLTLTNNTGNIAGVLGGSLNSPGGNIELYSALDKGAAAAGYANPAAGGTFANAPRVSLTGTAGSSAYNISSLNGNDWFTTTSGYNTSYGAANLANQWFSGFVNYVGILMTAQGNPNSAAFVSAAPQLFAQWRDGGGFTGLSNPNIGYIYENPLGQLIIGTEGFVDASPRFRDSLNASAAEAQANGDFANFFAYSVAAQNVPNNIQYTEVMLVNGIPTYQFGGASPSGVSLNDPYNSYTGSFETTVVPEISSALLIVLGALAASARRQR